MANLADYTDAEIAAAIHMIDGHGDCLQGSEKTAWRYIRGIVIRQAQAHREIEAENAAASAQTIRDHGGGS